MPGEQSPRFVSRKTIFGKRLQEELWDEFTEAEKLEAIQSLMDAGECEHAAAVANEAITEAIERYLHEVMIEMENRQARNE
jgi:hypothetical protein